MEIATGNRGCGWAGSVARLFPALFLCLCFFPLCPSVHAATVGSIEVRGLYSVDKEEMLDMLAIKEGGTIDEMKVRKGIKRAFMKGVFDDISVEATDHDPATVIVQVREKDIIQKVEISGDYPFSARRVREMLSLKEGDVTRYDLLESAAADLRINFSLMGYPDARVSIKAAEGSRPHRTVLNVGIEAGSPLIIREIVISGTSLVTRQDLRVSAGDVYDQTAVRRDLGRIRERLKKDGYVKPSLGPYEFRDGTLSVAMNPGKRLSVVIEGNSAISSKRLERETPFFEIETFNDEAVDEAVSRMLSLYHGEGYPSAQIAPVLKSEDESVTVSFFIYEGSRIKVRSVQFSGITVPAGNLRNILTLKEGAPYNPEMKERDREMLQEFYSALGFLDVSVREIEARADEKADVVDLHVRIEEGKKTTIGAIDIMGVTPDIKEKLTGLIPVKVGGPYNELDISDARFRILDHYSAEGYSNIDVSVQRTVENNAASLVFSVIEGKKKTIGRTIVVGNNRTRYAVIKREIPHNEGDPYSFGTIARERQKLYKLGLFTDIDIETHDSDEDVKDLLVRVREGNAGAFEFGFGYAEYEGARGFAEVSYRNLQGMNRQIMFRTELSSLARRFILQYYEPWLMGTNLPFRAFLLNEHRTEITVPDRRIRYEIERSTISAGTEKKLNDVLKAELYYEFSLVKTTNIQPDVVLSREDTGTLAISAIRPSLVFDTRDNPFDPKKGVLAGISLKVATPVLFSETHFAKLTLYASLFQKLHKRVVLAVSGRGGVAEGFGKTVELPIVERFFLGGRSSVRGYAQDMLGPKGSDGNPTGGNAFAMGSVELRADVGRGIGIVPFFDFGNVWMKSGDYAPSDIKRTAGIGLRYSTPVGPLRVDYGFKLDRDRICVDRKLPFPPLKGPQRCTLESPAELHFSIGHAF